jgi:8-amino-7-oxononanoate synthase
MADEDFLDKKLDQRREQHAFRQLRLPDGKTDFCSNDYLGIATRGLIEAAGDAHDNSWPAFPDSHASLSGSQPEFLSPSPRHGSGGSRLLAGNYPLIEETEKVLADFHQAAAGLVFNSGYDANLGVLSCVPQRGDSILYDQLSHASIRDGIRLSFAQAFSFAHNDLADLEKKLRTAAGNVFVVIESVYSMDGDQAPLPEIAALCRKFGAHLIVDEAHATGVIGPKGEGLVQAQGFHEECFARIHTFGKALGCHGAIVLGSDRLRDYLVNFSRALIYTTALPPASVRAIRTAYALFPQLQAEREQLQRLIDRFQQVSLAVEKLESRTPIQGVIVPGNKAVREVAARLQATGLDIRPILYPTVPKGGERLRIVLHAFNTMEELERVIAILK